MTDIRLELRLDGNIFEEDGYWIAELPQLDLCEVGFTQRGTLHFLCERLKNFISAPLSIAIGKDNKFSVFCAWRHEILDSIMHRVSIIQKQLEEYRNNSNELL